MLDPDERPASNGKRWAILIGFAALVSIAAASINHKGDQRERAACRLDRNGARAGQHQCRAPAGRPGGEVRRVTRHSPFRETACAPQAAPNLRGMERTMAEHENPAATSPRDRRQTVRTWSITLGISALLLTAMYAAAVTHYGAPHFDDPGFSDPGSVIGELSRADRI